MPEATAERRNHIVLLGDSIFDNAAYTHGAPDVIRHLRTLLPHSWDATLCAVDGATMSGLKAQLARVPVSATHLVIAIGGNDALQNSDLLSLRMASSAEALVIFADRITAFERAYRAAIEQAMSLTRRTAICTVYNGALEPERAAIARVGLALFNDVILRTAVDLRLDALELRSICTEPADYVNHIEPSGRGGSKIARAISYLVGAVGNAGAPPARVWGNSAAR